MDVHQLPSRVPDSETESGHRHRCGHSTDGQRPADRRAAPPEQYLAIAGVVALWRSLRAAEARAARLDVNLEVALKEASRYKAEAHEALRGLGEAIDSQFERWELTPAEREVGLLLLKGLSHKEVADVRSTSEPTVRQQALMVYRKSGLRNRSDLSAFFLEDLLLARAAP